MSRYISDDFTENFMKELRKEEYYLIGAECGSGKTTAIMEKLVPFAKRNNKNVLYVCNRVTLKDQLYSKYNEEEIKETGVFKQNENLTIGMYQSITTSLEKIGVYINEQDFDYIIFDEAHLIYDSADYDFNSFFFMEFINQLDAVIIFMSGTPQSVKKLEAYMTRDLKEIREPNQENNPIGKIYLVDNKETFEKLRFKYVNKGYQWLELVSRSKDFAGVKSKYRNYKVSTLLSNSNKNKAFYMTQDDEIVLQNIIEKEELICDMLFTTKFMDVGVNIQAHNHFIVAFNCIELPNTIEQFRSRIRVKAGDSYKVDLIFYIQRPKIWQLDNLQIELNRINDLYEEFGSYEDVILKHNQAFGKRFRSHGIISEKEFNPITKALLEDKLNFLKVMYYATDLMRFYKKFLSEMYPTKDIIAYKAVEIEKQLNKLMEGSTVVDLSDVKQLELRQMMKAYRIDPRHSNELPHFKRINDFLKEEKLPYIIVNPRVRIEGKQKRIWRLIKCAV
ncbi:DEAD/DEAH box helicase family protein [Kurthia sp. YJT4]|uniref:DEAD/DEAH box helicase family protein n=1 Tax=Kurthia sp. YJT4 TaxID=3049086 RepID=UPI00254FBB34|nr:DEAD/DEAH box helicase family protein [Kurthia sp. YJT4]WIL38005.1 DEAD/DEAH box helicase family protein [Kurthia sp. YJT4]